MPDDKKLNKLMQNPQVKALMKQIISKINHNKQKYNQRLSDDTDFCSFLDIFLSKADTFLHIPLLDVEIIS